MHDTIHHPPADSPRENENTPLAFSSSGITLLRQLVDGLDQDIDTLTINNLDIDQRQMLDKMVADGRVDVVMQSDSEFIIRVLKSRSLRRFYGFVLKASDENAFRGLILEAIRRWLSTHIRQSNLKVDDVVDVDVIATSMKKLYSSSDVKTHFYDLGPRGLGYFEYRWEDQPFGPLVLNLKGKQWAMGTDEGTIQARIQPIHFDIPPKSSEKVSALLREINDLSEQHKAANLIGHQLRTLLALSLFYFCESELGLTVSRKDRGLANLIDLSIKFGPSKHRNDVVKELQNLRATKAKDLMDDIVHCDYATVTFSEATFFASHIKHLLSLIYGRGSAHV